VRLTCIPVLVGTLAALAAASPATGQTKVSLAKPDAESAESFTQITAVRELPSGKVLLTDMRDKVVQLVDLASGSMTKVGREGQGPGEYGLPRGLFGLPSGETLLYDLMGRRLMTIQSDGKPGAFVELPRPPAAAESGPGFRIGFNDIRGVDAQGRLYMQGSPFNPDGGTPDSIPIMRWDRVKPTMDTVAFVKGPPGSSASRSGNNFTVRVGGGKIWTPAEAWDVTGDGRIARVMPSPYRVVWYAGGKPSAGAAQPYSPIKVTQADKDLFMEARRRSPPTMITIGDGRGGGGGTRSSGPAVSLPEPEFEATMPPFVGGPGGAAVLATPDGEVWVARTRPASDKIPSYDVFDRTGALVKKVSLNPNSRVVGFGKGTVYVARTDDDDLQYLQRYKKP
jgi:hypothetical protein